MQGGTAVSRNPDSTTDQLVLTRIINRIELCFGDENRNKFWKLSKPSECHICNKYKYTAIFFDKSTVDNDYTKVEDRPAVESLK